MTNDVFFTSDTHFWHKNIIKYCNRPFSSVEEMNEKLIANWNAKVKETSTIFHLGDFSFGNLNQSNYILSRLNGHKVLIKGNHDELPYKGFQEIRDHKTVYLCGHWFFLHHFAGRVWDKSHKGSFNLFGHSHGNLPDIGLRQKDVGVDCHPNYSPFHIDEIISKLKDRSY